jgi:hypothetical protein
MGVLGHCRQGEGSVVILSDDNLLCVTVIRISKLDGGHIPDGGQIRRCMLRLRAIADPVTIICIKFMCDFSPAARM